MCLAGHHFQVAARMRAMFGGFVVPGPEKEDEGVIFHILNVGRTY